MPTLRSFLLLAALATASLHCAATPDSEPGDDSDALDEALKSKGSPKWIYTGLLPHLEDASVTVSLSAHTARVTGLLPDGFAGDLPYYAEVIWKEGRGELSVVYPVATGAKTNGPGEYPDIRALAWTPTTEKAAWGGFPFLEYNHKRGLALHGPITAKDGEWQLKRGPVSHGCNRMQGEHVVEVAHLLGIDMGVPHKASEQFELDVPVHVSHDVDVWEGHRVDVDYPVLSGVKRPEGEDVKMFRTWDSRKMPTIVCPYDKTRELGADHCEAYGPDTVDVVTGEAITPAPADG